jgi:hypothetical protein
MRVLRIFLGCFALAVCFTHFSVRVLRRRCVLRIFPGVFCAGGVFYAISGRVSHRWYVLRIFWGCFEPISRRVPPLMCEVYTILAIVHSGAFYAFSRRVSPSLRVCFAPAADVNRG